MSCPKCGSKLWFNITNDTPRKWVYQECFTCGHTEEETIKMVEARKLMEYTNTLANHLTVSEFCEIMDVYRRVLDRLDGGLVCDDAE